MNDEFGYHFDDSIIMDREKRAQSQSRGKRKTYMAYTSAGLIGDLRTDTPAGSDSETV